jgi:SAM-dependent methyltransferase
MGDRPIVGDSARRYAEAVEHHGLREDTAWLLRVGRFPVGSRVLDVGCGTGSLIRALAQEMAYRRSVVGIELSPELAHHARCEARGTGAVVVEGDFLAWDPPPDWRPDALVMSYVLHHCGDAGQHLARAATLLPHGGRLYVVDRMAIDERALAAFPSFWERCYREAHEWKEDMPSLSTAEVLCESAERNGFVFVRKELCPHDRRPGAEGVPKTMLEFWRREAGRTFPPILMVSPAHAGYVDEIVDRLDGYGLPVAARWPVRYSGDLIRRVYCRCPWKDLLADFVRGTCARPVATALKMRGDASDPSVLARLSAFKRTERERWPSMEGEIAIDGLRAIVLPFHVPEPHEAEGFAKLVEDGGRGIV